MIEFIPFPAEGHNHEFEKPICLIHHNESVNYATEALAMSDKRFRQDVSEAITKIQERYNEIGRTLKLQLEHTLKEQGLWPKDFNKNTDHLMINKGVIYYARHKGD